MLCVVLWWHSGGGSLSSSVLFILYECKVGYLFVLSWASVQRVALGNVVS